MLDGIRLNFPVTSHFGAPETDGLSFFYVEQKVSDNAALLLIRYENKFSGTFIYNLEKVSFHGLEPSCSSIVLLTPLRKKVDLQLLKG